MEPGHLRGLAEDLQWLTPRVGACSTPPLDSSNMNRDDEVSVRGRPVTAALAKTLAAGDLGAVQALVDLGADLHYRRSEGYEALLDAVHGRDVFRDAGLIELLQFLIAHRVQLNEISSYGESGLRVLSRLGRFDAVRVLMDAGADEAQLAWTPLIKAVVLGTSDDLQRLLDGGAALEGRDWWSRTAWLVAVQSGDLAKAALLADRGADREAVGRCGKPALFFAIQCHRTAMLRWLLDLGFDVERTDEFGSTALMEAVEAGYEEGVELLLEAGAQIDREHNGSTALGAARIRGMVLRLLEAGADPKYLQQEGCRCVLGLPPDPDEALLEGVSEADFCRARTRRFGTTNPERMDEPFWLGMIPSGVNGYQATVRFNAPSSMGISPVWCAQRFGQTLTFLPDGRVVQIGGEHEDSYDPDFCIYNDVFVHEPGGEVRVYGYPKEVFAPTDFHTATLIDDSIYIIGSLGYSGEREYGRTPVYRLDTRTWRIDRIEPTGTCPGWIHSHRVKRVGRWEICVTGGEVLMQSAAGAEECWATQVEGFVLDSERLVWRPTSA